MSMTILPFMLNRMHDRLPMDYNANQNAAQTGFDLFACEQPNHVCLYGHCRIAPVMPQPLASSSAA